VIATSPRIREIKKDSHIVTWLGLSSQRGSQGKKRSQSPWLEPNRWLILGVGEGDEVIRVSKKKVKELEKNF